MESLLLSLDVDAPNPDDLNAIFRAAHSIKGGSGTFGFTDMTEVTHILETLLDRLRKEELALRDEMVDAFLASRRRVCAAQLDAPSEWRGSRSGNHAEVCERLNSLAIGDAAAATQRALQPAAPAPGRRKASTSKSFTTPDRRNR